MVVVAHLLETLVAADLVRAVVRFQRMEMQRMHLMQHLVRHMVDKMLRVQRMETNSYCHYLAALAAAGEITAAAAAAAARF